MSSRRHTPARHQEVVLYQKVLSSNGEEDAPDYICVPIEQAQKQAVTPAKGVTRRRAALTPGYGYERESPRPSHQVARRRGSAAPPPTPQTPQTRRHATPRSPLPPLEEDGGAFSPLRTPRRSSRPVGRPRGSVTPKQTPEKLFDDGRGSPEERRRKSKLAKSLPRTPDGKFAPKYDPQSEDYQSDGYQSEDVDDEGGESFRGSSPKYSSKKKQQQHVSPAKRQTKERAVQRRSPVKEPFVEEEVSDDENEAEAVATRPSRPLVEIQHGPNQSASSNSRSGDNISSGDSFDGITEYHKTINTTFNVAVISNSNIGSAPSTDDDDE